MHCWNKCKRQSQNALKVQWNELIADESNVSDTFILKDCCLRVGVSFVLLTFISETSNLNKVLFLNICIWNVFIWSLLASCWSEAVQQSSGALSCSLQSLTHIWGCAHTGDTLLTQSVCVLEFKCVVFIVYLIIFCHFQVVLPCLLDLLSVLEKPPAHSGLPRKPNRFDDVLRHILTYMEMEHKLDLRRVYAKNLVLFIERWGLNNFK